MTNPLCDADTAACIGFPGSLGGSCPYVPVRCRGGELVVENWSAAAQFVVSSGDNLNAGLVTGTTVYGTLLETTLTNPWCTEALVWVNHEFGMALTISDSDGWGMSGDISCAGTGVVLTTGGTGGSYTIDGMDGTTTTANAVLRALTRHHSFVGVYSVPASESFTIREQVRLTAATIRSGGRLINTFSAVMKGLILPRQS